MDTLDLSLNLEPLRVTHCFVAILCGFIVGVERQLKGKPAGIRTSILVCLGAYTFVVISSSFSTDTSPSRVIGQVVSGVGFLGAGLILSKDGLLHGVTSAAIIWVLAAIGCLIGVDRPVAAIMLALLTLSILLGVTFLERSFKKLRRGIHRDLNDKK